MLTLKETLKAEAEGIVNEAKPSAVPSNETGNVALKAEPRTY
jgi:hypothetical protein